MRNQLLLAAIAGLIFLFNLGGAHLWDEDEAFYAQTAREMLERGDYVVPYFNGEIFVHKPPVMFWGMIAGYESLGVSEFAARLGSVVFGIACVLVTYHLGRVMFSPDVGFWSGLILASTVNFVVIARAASPDAYLTFFSCLAMLAFVKEGGRPPFSPSWFSYALAYGAMGLAVLTKGPIGVALPTAVIGQFLLIVRAPTVSPRVEPSHLGPLRSIWHFVRRVFSVPHVMRTIWSMRPLTAVAVVLAVAGPWYLWVGLRTDGEWLRGFFGVHNFGRFLHPMESHSGPIFYYLLAIPIGFFPWSVLFGPSLLDWKRQRTADNSPPAAYILLACWLTVWVGFFSLASTKLPSYVIPAYPAVALFIGAFVDRWLRELASVSRTWIKMIWGTVALVGVGMSVALPVVAHIFLADNYLLAIAGLMPMVAAACGLYFGLRGRIRHCIATLATFSVVFSLAIFGLGAAYVDAYQTTPPLTRMIAAGAVSGEASAIGSFRYFRPSVVYYANQTIERCNSADEVQSFFQEHPTSAFLLTTDNQYEQLSAKLPADVVVLDKRGKFLQQGDILLLGRATPVTASQIPAVPSATRN